MAASELGVRHSLWFEKLIAIIALVNLALVLFDMSYIPWRNLYFWEIPPLTQLYDPVKGIEAHRETQQYLNKVNELETQVRQTGLDSSQVESLLEELRHLSNEMIEDNPFAVANKSGTLEKIKNQIRDRTAINSSHKAFARFWSRDYLSQGWQKEINFFNTSIRPQIQANYYRGIGINGKFIDDFWLIDLPFVIVFGLDFFIRTFSISRRHTGLTWWQAILRRWYDTLLLLPFWRWLRVVPVTIRLQQAHLLNLQPVQAQIRYDFTANFAEELTEIVGIRLIDQIQELIRQGHLAKWLFHPQTRRPYVDINNTNEVKAIASRLLHLSVYQVLPQIQPDLESLLHSSLESILKKAPAYQQLQNMPGMSQLPTQLTQTLVKDVSQATYSTMTTLLEDPVAIEHANRLIQNFTKALQVEIQKQDNLLEIQSLLIDMLEEIKINYVKSISETGVENILGESEQLHQIIEHRTVISPSKT